MSKSHGDCCIHAFRTHMDVHRSIGTITIETCNNCLSVVVIQKRDTDKRPTVTSVEMRNSAYPKGL